MSDMENKSSPQPEEAKDEPMSSGEEVEDTKPVPDGDEGGAGDACESKSEGEEETVSRSPKKPTTPKKDSKQKDENEGKEGGNDGTPKLGLLERPVVIESGKREKKKVERLEVSMTLTPKDKKVDVPDGVGTKLGDIPRVEYQLNRNKADDLKLLHRIIFGRLGTPNEIKKNLRKFCGFSFAKDDKEYTKKMAVLGKCTTTMLRLCCEVLDLEKSGTKDALLNRVMDFLMNPSSSGKPLPKKKKSGSGDKGKKRKRSSAKKSSEGSKKSSPKKKTAKSKEEVESSEDDDESEKESEEEEEEEEENDASDEESEEEQPKKKKARKESPKPSKKDSKKESKKVEKKKAEKKQTPKKKAKEESEESEDDSSDDDEPLMPKQKPPTDDELKDVIKKILDGANLEEVTMKTVCKQVYSKFPDFDLTARKDFIKSTVKQIIR